MEENLTKVLLKQSAKLPVSQLREVIDFTEFLLAKNSAASVAAINARNPLGVENALDQFVGGIENGSLAKDIDDDLYGSAIR